MSLNILMISSDAPPYLGGISRLVGLLERGLLAAGHQITLLHPKMRFRELKFSTIPFHRHSSRYDIVHLHGPTPFLSDLTLMINKRRKIVYTHHAEICWISEKLSKVYRSFHHLLAKRAQAVIVHSHDYARIFERANVFVVRMPCPLKPPSNLKIGCKPSAFTVLYVGQFRPFKGIWMLIKVAATLKDVNFVLAGEGYLKPKLMKMAKRLKNVYFVSATNDDKLRQLYHLAHVICLPSVNTTEGYGLVLIEGALYGCVPLASNFIGVAENVSFLKGLVFEKKSLTSLAKNIAMLAEDRDLWMRFALQSYQAAYNYAVTYAPESYVKRHEEIYSSIYEIG